jgi:hypothetical protein
VMSRTSPINVAGSAMSAVVAGAVRIIRTGFVRAATILVVLLLLIRYALKHKLNAR